MTEVEDLALSACAVLIAEACNISLAPIVQNEVPALSELIHGLQRGSRTSTLGRAIGELGRIPKTLHLLNDFADPDYRRHCLTQLNRHEARNGLARRVFHGQNGELRQRYREGQEDQLGTLGQVVNALILWTTRHMDAALAHLRAKGVTVKPEELARLSPLGSKHFNVLGRYHFDLSDAVRRGEPRRGASA